MTGLIMQGMSEGRFSLWRFYWARARRIIPALIALCGALLVFGWFFVAPSEYERIGNHALAALGFFSNFVYKDESGYFDSLAREKWLLHTWALSAEWQFYLLYPLIIAGVSKVGRSVQTITIALIGLAAISLAASIITSPIKPDFAFFILVTRIWEMVAGGLVYLFLAYRAPKKNMSAAITALVLMTGALLFYHGDMIWPGYYAVLPVVGAMAFIIYAPNDHWLVDNIVARKVGDWSYSLYLWHWPVVVGFYYFGVTMAGWQILGLGLSLLLGAASYRWIEQPARRLDVSYRSFVLIFFPFLLIGLAGTLIAYKHGFPARVSDAVLIADRASITTPPPSLRCPDDTGPPGVILWGDSHAGAIIPALQEALGQPIASHIAQCPVILNARLKGKTQKANCVGNHAALLQQLDETPPSVPLVIASRFSAQIHGPNESVQHNAGLIYDDLDHSDEGLDQYALYQKKLITTLCRAAQTRPTYVLKPIPEMGVHVPRTAARQLMTGRTPNVSLSMDEYNERHAIVLHALDQAVQKCGITLLGTAVHLCPDDKNCEGVENGLPLYSDDDHLNEHGNKRIVPLFETIKR